MSVCKFLCYTVHADRSVLVHPPYEPGVCVLVQLRFLEPQSCESCEVYVSLFGVVSATWYYLLLRASKNRYQLIQKLHYLSHIALNTQREASQSTWFHSPLSTSVRCQEDFAGRPARFSRCRHASTSYKIYKCTSKKLNLGLSCFDNGRWGKEGYGCLQLLIEFKWFVLKCFQKIIINL